MNIKINQKSERDFLPTLMLAISLGVLGVHRLYVGKLGTGLLQMLTLGGLMVWTLIDIIRILIGSFKDGDGLPIKP